MKQERLAEIETELRRRLTIVLEHTTFEEFTVGGSMIRFQVGLATEGYPFAPEPYMDESFVQPVIGFEEVDLEIAAEYEELLNKLYEEAKYGEI